ncbi:MAG: hypothetical protein ABIG71_01875 [Candidatus Uhrbacteria bacterium]
MIIVTPEELQAGRVEWSIIKFHDVSPACIPTMHTVLEGRTMCSPIFHDVILRNGLSDINTFIRLVQLLKSEENDGGYTVHLKIVTKVAFLRRHRGTSLQYWVTYRTDRALVQKLFDALNVFPDGGGLHERQIDELKEGA